MFSGIKSFFKSVASPFSKSNENQQTAGPDTPPSVPVTAHAPAEEEDVCTQSLAEAVRDKSRLLGAEKGPLPVYAVPLSQDHINIAGCKRFSFGKYTTKHNRTIMVLGATGAGKSTLINGMINYILGVDWVDPYRFKLVHEDQSRSQAESQTSEVTVYRVNHQEGFTVNYSVTIVDTPGFGDTRGIERDREITEQLRNLFSDQLGVAEIDAVCFVAQASLARLTPSQKYVFDSVLSIFGKDVAENIRVLVTFADGQRPPVLEAINVSGVPCPKTENGLPVHFKFNNSALFADNRSSAAASRDGDEDGDFDQMFWNMGTKSMKKFFVALNEIKTKSLTMTNEVLRERQRLENSVENLQKQVKVGLAKLEEIKETAEKIKEHEAEISRNENFEFDVKINKPVQVDISGSGIFLTNCQQCHHTCHDNCAYADDKDKIHCCAMGPDGYCVVCPGKCLWSQHFNQRYKWEYKEVMERRTVKELKEKYLQASEAKTPVQALLQELKRDYDAVQDQVRELMQRSADCLNRLKEIALKPNPLSTPEYIDMLIEGEKSEAKPGWKKRVQYLMDMRGTAETMAKVARGEELLASSDFPTCSQGSTENQDNPDAYTNQNQNQNQNQSDMKTDADKSENDGKQGQMCDADQDESEPHIPDQDKTGSDTNDDQDSEADSESINDQGSDLDSNPDQDETGSDTNDDQDGDLDSNPDQDKTGSDTNDDQDGDLDSNPDQDETGSDTNDDQD